MVNPFQQAPTSPGKIETLLVMILNRPLNLAWFNSLAVNFAVSPDWNKDAGRIPLVKLPIKDSNGFFWPMIPYCWSNLEAWHVYQLNGLENLRISHVYHGVSPFLATVSEAPTVGIPSKNHPKFSCTSVQCTIPSSLSKHLKVGFSIKSFTILPLVPESCGKFLKHPKIAQQKIPKLRFWQSFWGALQNQFSKDWFCVRNLGW